MWLLLAFQREKQRSWNTFFILWFFFFFDESATSVTSQLQRPLRFPGSFSLRLRRFVTLSLSLHSAHSISNNIFAEIEPCHVARSHWSGVIWKGDELIDGVPQTLEMLRAKGKKLVFVTNNSLKSRSQYAEKFRSLGISVSQVRSCFVLSLSIWKLRCCLNCSTSFFFCFFIGLMLVVSFLCSLNCSSDFVIFCVWQDEIFSSSFAAAMYLKVNNFPSQCFFIVFPDFK